MKKAAPLIILWCALLAGSPLVGQRARAAPLSSDWPSLNFDAAQSNYNSTEKTISAHNVLKLKVKWVYPSGACSPSFPMSDASYPILAAGHVFVPIQNGATIHVRELDALTGRCITRYKKNAQGGMLWDNGSLYLAGVYLQDLDPATGNVQAKINVTSRLPGSIFVKPLADKKLILAGFANRVQSGIYTVDAASNQVLHKLPSTSAIGAVLTGRVVTSTLTGSVFYDEASGKLVAKQPFFGSDWFAGSSLAYVVASPPKKKARLYAYGPNGHLSWSRAVGPVMATQNTDWPHAVGPTTLYVHVLTPREGIQALDPATGNVEWTRSLANVNQLVLANDVLFALTYGLGQPVRVVALDPATGKVIGAIVLSSGYFAFWAPNGLMVANGMVYVRVVGPGNVPELVALGL
jgi:outer membrane protein assembly factor BamB